MELTAQELYQLFVANPTSLAPDAWIERIDDGGLAIIGSGYEWPDDVRVLITYGRLGQLAREYFAEQSLVDLGLL